jgi:Mn2+/Fe2+ NRAMP family transporter
VFFYVAYVITGFMVHPDWSAVAGQMVMPQFRPEKSYLIIVMGLLGTTIAPWMQFYQQSTVVEKGLGVKDYKYARIDVVIGGLVMIVVALFIVIACSGTLFRGGIRIETAKDAALALKPLAGEHCSALFAFGLLNASFVSAMILPIAAAYSVCEGLGWEAGVDKRLKDAPQFYFLFTILILIGAGIVMVPGISLIKIMLFSQVANSIFLPFVLVFILILVNDRHLMGEHKNSRFFNIISWATVAVLLALTAGLMATIFSRRP